VKTGNPFGEKNSKWVKVTVLKNEKAEMCHTGVTNFSL